MYSRIGDEEFRLYSDFIRKKFGISLPDTKKNLLETRLNKLLRLYQLNSFDELFYLIKKDRTLETLSNVVDRISTNHTYFYREKEHYNFLKKEIKHLLDLQSQDRYGEFRIWIAGCSFGDEPYTFALYLNDLNKFNSRKINYRVLATDISKEALEMAEMGVYPFERLEKLPKHLRLQGFNNTEEGLFSVKNEFRNRILFRRLNLISESFPFKKKFHLISCRNVMIYFNEETKKKLLKRFYDHLDDDGILFIGHSESIGKDSPYFSSIEPSIFKKKKA
jgi:chemotaxis protein methyltransferase CheR